MVELANLPARETDGRQSWRWSVMVLVESPAMANGEWRCGVKIGTVVTAVYSIQRGGDVEEMLVVVSLRSRSRDNAACGDENNDHRQVRSLSELLYGSMLAGWAAAFVSHSRCGLLPYVRHHITI
jgi:hypothetical protein